MFFKTRIQLYNIPDFLFGYNSGILSCLLKRQIYENREYAVSRYLLKVGRSMGLATGSSSCPGDDICICSKSIGN